MSAFRGLTLVELLVVIIIVSTLVATVIPVMAPSIETRRLREAARGVSAFFGAARARAIQTGRPVGVIIPRMPTETGAAMALFVAKQPPPFAGLISPSFAQVGILQTSDLVDDVLYDKFRANFDAAFVPSLIQMGDRVQFNNQGPWYEIMGPPPSDSGPFLDQSTGIWLRTRTTGRMYPWLVASDIDKPENPKVSYQVDRQPVPSAAAPLQLPSGVVIDLFASGIGDDYFHHPQPYGTNDNPDPIVITFTPTGALDLVRHNEGTSGSNSFAIERPRSAVHLLVGRFENVGDPDSSKANWLNEDALWVSIAPQMGQVGTAPNDANDAQKAWTIDPKDRDAQIEAARRFARQMHTMGGK